MPIHIYSQIDIYVSEIMLKLKTIFSSKNMPRYYSMPIHANNTSSF